MIRLTSLLENVELLPNGNLRIPNVEEITPAQWERINRFMVNKGYNMRGGDDCKQTITKFLQSPGNESPGEVRYKPFKDWVDTIAMVLHLNDVKPVGEPTYNPRNVLRAALRAFGETDNIREAGYIFPGGKLLSLTGNPNQRDLDHTEINSVYSKLGIEIPSDERQSNHNIMFAFMKDCRVIRIGGSQPQADMFHQPTRQQAQRLAELIKEHGGEMMIICRSTTLGAKDHYYKKGTSPYVILRDIVYFYKTGKFLTPENG
jgi:hypothetical protein